MHEIIQRAAYLTESVTWCALNDTRSDQVPMTD